MNRENNISFNPAMLLRQRPQASAHIRGSEDFPQIRGSVCFYQTRTGVFVLVQVSGLPESNDACASPIFGFHIHEGESCTGSKEDRFADTLGHFNPNTCPHPYHAGDLPPLFSAHGNAFLGFLTDRFSILDVIGRTAVIHADPDDFTSQPSGHSGMKLACGKIKANR